MEQLQQIITTCAEATQAKGFDLTQHATTIGLIATEVTEAIRCLNIPVDSAAVPLHTYLMRLQGATGYMESYRKVAADHFDNTTIADQEHLLEELADICIRVFSYVGGNHMTAQFIAALLDKVQVGTTRPPLHGKYL